MIKDNLKQVMNYARWGLGTGFLLAVWWVGLTGVSSASEHSLKKMKPGRLSALATTYRTECGSCHHAYAPRLLPAASWKAIMIQLDDHFGENAELSAEMAADIRQYLVANAGAKGRGFLKKLKDPSPLRITTLPNFIHKHDEIPRKLVAGNPEVRNFNDCSVCHKGAIDGKFSDDTVNIPGFGHWDD